MPESTQPTATDTPPEPSSHPTSTAREAVPLSVWLTGAKQSRQQRAGRYVPASMAHPGKMLPAIAAQAITDYTNPGDLVLDPMCGIGTTLVEAAHLGRDAVGIEYESPWAQLARRNLHHARSQGATGHATVHHGDARHAANLLNLDLIGRVALVLTSPPYGSSLHGQVEARPDGGIGKRDNRYGHDRGNLAYAGLDGLLDAMVEIVTGCIPYLKPGGVVAMTVRPYWEKGALIDLPGRLTTAITDRTPLTLMDRNIALLAAIRDDQLVTRASFFQLDQVRRARAKGIPRHLVAHEDLLAWRRDADAASNPQTTTSRPTLVGSDGAERAAA